MHSRDGAESPSAAQSGRAPQALLAVAAPLTLFVASALAHGVALAVCEAGRACEERGLCSWDFGCAAARDTDCRASSECLSDGTCDASGGVCIAANDASCQNSAMCRYAGLCSADEGRCMARTNADCTASRDCFDDGLCIAVGGVCVVGPEGCAGTDACKINGSCRLEAGRCKSRTQTCRASPYGCGK